MWMLEAWPDLAGIRAGAGDVDVSVLFEPFVAGEAVGVDLHDLLAAHEPDGVEGVDVQIAEDAPAGSEVVLGRWRRVMGRRAHDENRPNGAGRNRFVRRAIAGIEAPLEANLNEDPSAGGILEHAVHRREVKRNRLLAEGWEACTREPQEGRLPRRVPVAITSVSRPASTSASGVSTVRTPSSVATSVARRRSRSANRHGRDIRETDQCARVVDADPADADHPEIETVRLAHRSQGYPTQRAQPRLDPLQDSRSAKEWS